MQEAIRRRSRKDTPISTMDQDQLHFIEELGVLFEESGAAPMMGRIYGALLISRNSELTAGELAEILHASRGAISHGTRQLVDMGMIRRIHKPGKRMDFFQVRPEGFVDMTRVRVSKIMGIRQLFERGLESIPQESTQARAALEENLLFIDYWDSFIDDFFKGWQEYKGDKRG